VTPVSEIGHTEEKSIKILELIDTINSMDLKIAT
jgi:hypothetical protein